ncbi:hypothetical protein Tco_0678735 [Tanacetum coccineum]|uniref:Uncharacterized protein n=1 Tax=Tanacetum coccineum TaxID=301880 RepID=A0ABQ4XH65_9ASTR
MTAPTIYVSVNSLPRHDILPENDVLERGYTTGIQKLKFVQTTKKRLNSAHMKATYTTRRGCKHNTEDVCHPFGSDGSFRKWPITTAYNKDTVKMTAVSRTFGSDGAITAAYDKGTDIKEMDKIKAKTDKAEHEKERVHKSRELSSFG